ncbi:MAG: hypothetical protein H0Z24_08570 [Thermosipho sp. (in: Bacteria)]|nr:hypothetical protein [Thermosipho sp. (in: thermotogales)]
MKKKLVSIILMVIVMLTFAKSEVDILIEKEMKGSFLYFWEQANTDENSAGYGLVRDRYPGNPTIASIAATGFGLSAIPIGVEYGWITKEEGYKRALGTLKTIWNLENFHGFWYHFLDINTGKRAWKSEISTIDSAILVAGVLTVGEYFGGEIKELAKKIYDRMNWKLFVDYKNNYFYMAYYPEKGFQGHWDFYAEQLIMYILGCGSDKYPISKDVYLAFKRHLGSYKTEKFVHSWFGSLFTYQFSHAWVDFRGFVDDLGINWFDNSVQASLANYYYCLDLSDQYKSFSENSWGLSACDSPHGYEGKYGSIPNGYDNNQNVVDGTIATHAAIGSVVFVPEKSLKALEYYYTMPRLVGKYGLKASFNLDLDWFATDFVGIDKGIGLLMLSNYKDELIWKIFMQNENVKKAMKILFKHEE